MKKKKWDKEEMVKNEKNKKNEKMKRKKSDKEENENKLKRREERGELNRGKKYIIRGVNSGEQRTNMKEKLNEEWNRLRNVNK